LRQVQQAAAAELLLQLRKELEQKAEERLAMMDGN
jgi:hypothetical protein